MRRPGAARCARSRLACAPRPPAPDRAKVPLNPSIIAALAWNSLIDQRDNHVNRPAQWSISVLISGIWYQSPIEGLLKNLRPPVRLAEVSAPVQEVNSYASWHESSSVPLLADSQNRHRGRPLNGPSGPRYDSRCDDR